MASNGWRDAAEREAEVPAVSDETRLLQLEELAAHQARVIDELSDQIAEQWKVVDQTRAKLDRLTERFLSLEETTQPDTPITRPPHY